MTKVKTARKIKGITAYGDGGYRVTINRVGYRRKTATFDTLGSAEKWQRKELAALDQGVAGFDVAGARTTSVESLFVRYRDEISPTKIGARNETNHINRIMLGAVFMKKRLNQLGAEDIAAWRDQRLKTITPGSVRREFTVISTILNHAIKEWQVPLPINPCLLVKRPTENKSRAVGWTDKEIQMILKNLNFDETLYPKTTTDFLGFGVLLAVETAMRSGELFSLTISNIHLNERNVFLERTKNGASREVPLSSRALTLFKTLMHGMSGDQKLFPPQGTLAVYFNDAKKAVGLHHLHFHDLRREAITRAAPKFSNILELSAFSGHRDIKQLKTYYAPKIEDIASKLG